MIAVVHWIFYMNAMPVVKLTRKNTNVVNKTFKIDRQHALKGSVAKLKLYAIAQIL